MCHHTPFSHTNSAIIDFFNKIAIFGANLRSVISQLTDPFSPRRCHCLLELIITEQRHKKNGEKPLRFDHFSVLLLTFFSIKLLFSVPTRDPWYLSSQTKFRPAATVTCLRLLKQSSDAKRTVRNHCVLMILQFFYSPFFQLNCYFWYQCAIRDISAHRPNFAPSPPSLARVY